MVQCHTQVGNITTNMKVKIESTLTKLSTKKIVTCNWNVNWPARVRYEIILRRYILTAPELNLDFYKHFIVEDDGPLKESTTTMVDLVIYDFKILNKGKITPE